MKKVVKGILLSILMSIVYMIINGISHSILPFSEWFVTNSMKQETNLGLTMIYMLAISGTIYFITQHARCKGKELYMAVIGSVFFTLSFMTQIETIIFGSAFEGLSLHDILLMVLGDFISISLTGLLYILILKRKTQEHEIMTIDWKKFVKCLLLNGLIYMVIYFIFGYFVAWKSEDLRIFYSGSAEDPGFFYRLYVNARDNFIIYPIQYVRGILFTLGIIPLMRIRWKSKYGFMISVCAVFLCTGMGLIVPNFLFPDAVRLAH
ncbi:MAG: hypothetical protein GX567_01385, partial [Clostridia bacterium]|nr:hypothetical protein [Clostridia bacterium]